MKRPIQLVSALMVVLLLSATAFSFLSELKVDEASAEMADAQKHRYTTYLLADEFRQSSEDLTRFARLLASTGKPQFVEYYQGILDIRQGRRPRPENYHLPYWDAVVAGDVASPDSNVQKPLQDLMREAGFSDAELNAMDHAIALSDTLAEMETKANNAALGLFADASGNYTVRGAPDLQLAQSIVYSPEYSAEKAKITSAVGEFYKLVDQRMSERVADAMASKDAARTRANTAIGMLVATSVAVGIFLLAFCVTPLRRLTNAMQMLAKGKTDTEIPCQKARSEFGILSRQIAEYKAASDRIAEMGEAEKASREKAIEQSKTALALQSEVENAVELAKEGDFSARVDIETDDAATLQIADGMNTLMERLDNATKSILHAMTALGDGDVDTRISIQGQGRYAQISDTAQTAQRKLGELMAGMAESAEEARMSQESVMAQQEVANRLQVEIDALLGQAQHGCFDGRIDIATNDENVQRIASGLNNLMGRYNDTISELVKLFTAFGAGDLTAELNLASDGRYGDLKDSADTARSLLINLIEQSTGSANEVLTAVNRVRADSQTVAEAMQSQAASIEETSAATVEMNKAINDNASSLTGASELAQAVTHQASTGSETVEQVIEAVEEIKKRSDKIADFVSIIENISFQTNLLALNASVEAARAGEAGRGFAVVASEVRNLSLRASEAATEIADLIRATTDSVDHGVGLSKRSGEALAQIASSIEDLQKTMADITTTGQMQATSFQEIQQAIGEINQSTQRTATSADCSAEVADSLVQTTVALQQTLSQFSTTAGPNSDWKAA